jgi:adenylate kinase
MISKPPYIIVVFGISGVGKSSAISNFIQGHPEWAHVQAGKLLQNKMPETAYDDLRLGTDEKILKNQNLLVSAFDEYLKTTSHSKIIFDGHSVIDSGQDFFKVPPSIIKKLYPQKIIFIFSEPEKIVKQREKDPSRSRPIYSLEKTTEFQKISLNHAKAIANELDIPFNQITGDGLSNIELAS